MIEKIFTHIQSYVPLLCIFSIFIILPLFVHREVYIKECTFEIIAIILIVITFSIKLINKKIFNLNFFDTLFCLFICLYIFVFLISRQYFDFWLIIKSLSLICFYFICKNNLDINKIWIILFIAGFLQGIWCILQWFQIIQYRNEFFWGTACFSNPALLSVFLALSLLSSQYIILKNKSLKLGKNIISIFLLLCIIILDSRATWIALLAGYFGFLICSVEYKKYLFLLKNKYTICIVPILISFFIGLYFLRLESANGRLLIWKIIYNDIINNFSFFRMKELQSNYMLLQAKWFSAHSDVYEISLANNNLYAFNEILRIIFEIGFLGLIIFCVLLVIALYVTFKNNNSKYYEVGTMIILILFFACFGYPFSSNIILLTIVMLLGIISSFIYKYNKLVKVNLIHRKCICILVFLILIGGGFKEYYHRKEADNLLQVAQKDSSFLKSEEMSFYFKYFKFEADFVLAYGKTLFDNKLYFHAVPVLEQGYKLRPSSDLVCDLGKCYQNLKFFNKAEQCFIHANNMLPNRILPHYLLFELYKEMNNFEKASKKAQDILKAPVKVINTSVIRIRHSAKEYIKKYN